MTDKKLKTLLDAMTEDQLKILAAKMLVHRIAAGQLNRGSKAEIEVLRAVCVALSQCHEPGVIADEQEDEDYALGLFAGIMDGTITFEADDKGFHPVWRQ
jgi:hypothetical protein